MGNKSSASPIPRPAAGHNFPVRYTERDKTYHFTVVGLGAGGVGQSAVVIRFLKDLFVEEYDPTIEDLYRKLLVIDDEKVDMEIVDTAGQDEYSATKPMHMKQGDAFWFVFAIDSERSFDAIETLINEVQKLKDKSIREIPCILVGNKVDLDHIRKVPSSLGVALAEKYGMQYYESSAKISINVSEAFFDLFREAKKRGVETVQ